MKITLESNVGTELEVVIKGDITSEEVHNLINLLNDFSKEKCSSVLIGKKDEKEYIIALQDIEYFGVESNALIGYSHKNKYKLKGRLTDMEDMYANYGFRRISKGIVLNCNFIKYLEIEFSGNYTVLTKSNNKFTMSRRYVQSVKKYIREEM